MACFIRISEIVHNELAASYLLCWEI